MPHACFHLADKVLLSQKLLSLAISTLVGSGGPPRASATLSDGADVSVWEQSQLQRQQVLDSLFAKREQKESALVGKVRPTSEAQVRHPFHCGDLPGAGNWS